MSEIGEPKPTTSVQGSTPSQPSQAQCLIPPKVMRLFEQAYGWEEDDWWEQEPFIEVRAAELAPSSNVEWLVVGEIANLDREQLHLRAHAGRIQRLATPQAIREILKPGYAKMAFGGPSYGKLDGNRDGDASIVHRLPCRDGDYYPLDEQNNPELETQLLALAQEKLKQISLGPKGISTQAFELKIDVLKTIQQMQALAQAKQDRLIDAFYYRREAALRAKSSPAASSGTR
jgi:hypothetical protein